MHWFTALSWQVLSALMCRGWRTWNVFCTEQSLQFTLIVCRCGISIVVIVCIINIALNEAFDITWVVVTKITLHPIATRTWNKFLHFCFYDEWWASLLFPKDCPSVKLFGRFKNLLAFVRGILVWGWSWQIFFQF